MTTALPDTIQNPGLHRRSFVDAADGATFDSLAPPPAR